MKSKLGTYMPCNDSVNEKDLLYVHYILKRVCTVGKGYVGSNLVHCTYQKS